ncbi:hypothetical protein O2V63_14975 [Modestobacter sp. VKM Ac-2977]|uniref:hypothetical protein n=1 Tax=Modestobacter sp. VKM Ac-2977 TaxID=3004131 RepID=UPI0022AB3CF5|nr:hypothetical protein [Modestobacter sp. VKM Ac-2977]MCZ2821646.1 hypothetical protein [Modestobacter sp. VKM Ac-2977]
MVRRHIAAALTGLLIASGIGVLAGAFEPDEFWLRAVVFAFCTSTPAYGVGWLVFLSGVTGEDPPAHVEETIEHQWLQRSSSAAFLDLVIVAGLGALALAVTDLDLAASSVLMWLILFAFADVAVRLTVLRRRAA